jgi:hypothetical protein
LISKAARAGLVVALACVCSTPAVSGVELRPEALKAFERYVQLTEARLDAEIRGTSPFLWIDRAPDAQRRIHLDRLKRGAVVVAKLETRDGGREIKAPGALIHHWIGTVLLPNVALDRAVAFVKDYPRYPNHFAPMIVRSQVHSAAGDRFEVTMRTTTRKVITVTLDADYAVEYRPLTPARLWSKSVASNVFEIDGEARKPAEQGRGYLYRLVTYCSFEQRVEGTYEQCESLSLTTDIPLLFRWIVMPFVTSVPRETLEFTLGRVRAGVK